MDRGKTIPPPDAAISHLAGMILFTPTRKLKSVFVMERLWRFCGMFGIMCKNVFAH